MAGVNKESEYCQNCWVAQNLLQKHENALKEVPPPEGLEATLSLSCEDVNVSKANKAIILERRINGNPNLTDITFYKCPKNKLIRFVKNLSKKI